MTAFQDTRKFKLAVAQTCDSIQAAADWIERDSKDVENVSFELLLSQCW